MANFSGTTWYRFPQKLSNCELDGEFSLLDQCTGLDKTMLPAAAPKSVMDKALKHLFVF